MASEDVMLIAQVLVSRSRAPTTPKQHGSLRDKQADGTSGRIRKTPSLLDFKKGRAAGKRADGVQSEEGHVLRTGGMHAGHGTHSTSSLDRKLNALKTFLGAHPHSDGLAQQQQQQVPIRAFLRLRPCPSGQDSPTSDHQSTGNIHIINSHSASMVAPSADDAMERRMQRSSSISSSLLGSTPWASGNPPCVYDFTQVFEASVDQEEVFNKSTLPLVRDVLGSNVQGRMDNALVFAYGVSGGGKTCESWLWQGGPSQGRCTLLSYSETDKLDPILDTIHGQPPTDPGIIPRTLQTIMHSTAHKQTPSYLRPCKAGSLEMPAPPDRRRVPANMPATASSARLDSENGRQLHLAVGR